MKKGSYKYRIEDQSIYKNGKNQQLKMGERFFCGFRGKKIAMFVTAITSTSIVIRHYCGSRRVHPGYLFKLKYGKN